MKVFLYTATAFVALNLPAGGVSAQTVRARSVRSVPATGPTVELTASNVGATATPGQYVVSTATPRYSGAGKVVLIPSAQTQPEQLATLAEDMGIMCRLLDGKVSEANPGTEAGHFLLDVLRSKQSNPFPDFFGSDSYATEGMYVDGYGALFLVRVNFPLTAPAEAEPATEAPEEPDQLWAETKRRMYSPDYKEKRKSTAEAYDALRVEKLKGVLTHAMKHAANIRHLGPEDWVTIAVRGAEPTVEPAVVSSHSGRYSRRVLLSPSEGSSVLTIRARRAAIEAFFKKDLTYEQFQKQTQTLTY
ncbi:MAG: hypothetical protein JSU70_21950 [Phycisphaerales bacterium]|nr:MAG: hypothetical protein JSU70_21950 [Phycisphaerales bacterium]